MSDRPMRVCDVCGGVDDHPRHLHVVVDAPAPDPAVIQAVLDNDELDSDTKAAVLADLMDTTIQLRHMDCCRNLGCTPSVTGEPGPCFSMPELTGDDLLAHITGV